MYTCNLWLSCCGGLTVSNEVKGATNDDDDDEFSGKSMA